ncbi:hypothetical protein LMG27177_01131 [Paraburkholderia fynbosensis]|uniref:Uncharacterized protein n=1 Tax=Paraburkholderia fynbosensis TaxID=1200993 RepID=A0A6J5FPE0_9BURK|nr:hypothetical protein LMG27177_01131 [Paraburkholderia fynbosensis]
MECVRMGDRVTGESDGRWTGSVRFVADAGISALVFAVRAGVLATADEGVHV